MKWKYGLAWDDDTTDATIELYCYRNFADLATGVEQWMHLLAAIKHLWPEQMNGRRCFVPSEWDEIACRSWCENQFTTWWGPSSSGKTTRAAAIVMAHYLSSPHNTTVSVCSTTGKMLRRRIWGELVRLWAFRKDELPLEYMKAEFSFVYKDPNKKDFKAGKDEAKAGIFGIAVRSGSEEDAVGNIVGTHNDYNALVIDEMQATLPAAVEAFDNLSTGLESKFLGIGNPTSWLDPLGKYSMPAAGKASISTSTPSWQTKSGRCYFFNGLNSPGVKDPKRYPFLLTKKQIDEMRDRKGENSPSFWTQRVGFMPPDGVSNTVLSPQVIEKYSMTGTCEWKDYTFYVAGLDAGFTTDGDESKLSIARCGVSSKGVFTIHFLPIITIFPQATEDRPFEHDLVYQVDEHLKKLGITMKGFALDTTAQQTALASIFDKEIGPGCLRVTFGGASSDLPASLMDRRPGREVYSNKVSELWYNVREFGESDQIRGLDEDSVIEFCTRIVINRSGKTAVEPKEDMKSRLGRSPDNADAKCLCIEVLRQRYNITPGRSAQRGPEDPQNEIERRRFEPLIESGEYEMDDTTGGDLYASFE